MPDIAIEIDGFSNSIIEVVTGRTLATRIVPWHRLTVRQSESTVHWQFDWQSEVDDPGRSVLALLVRGGRNVQGLVSMSDADDHVYMNLIESAPWNIGKRKRFRGVPANLFACACLRSRLVGFNGVLAMDAKTELIDHYHETLGARRIGRSHRMIIDADTADELIERYFSQERDKWPN